MSPEKVTLSLMPQIAAACPTRTSPTAPGVSVLRPALWRTAVGALLLHAALNQVHRTLTPARSRA